MPRLPERAAVEVDHKLVEIADQVAARHPKSRLNGYPQGVLFLSTRFPQYRQPETEDPESNNVWPFHPEDDLASDSRPVQPDGPALPLNFQPRYNGTPTQDFAACLLDEDGNHAIVQLCWGLVPSWAKDSKMGPGLINARAETVHTKPSFGAAFRSRRCLVPANGWFEWDRAWQAALLPGPCERVSAVLRRSVGALEQGRRLLGVLRHHHDGGRAAAC